MAENTKRYYWLKLKDDFFDEKYIKALRKLPQGDSLAIVYLKMQLKSLKTEGIIKYEGIMPDAMTELALLIDEDENVVRLAVEALIRFGVVERWDNDTFYLSALQQLIGSETQGAARVRKHRELKNAKAIEGAQPKALQCNEVVTPCNIEKEKDIELDIEKEVEKKKKRKPLAENPPTEVETFFESVWALYPKKTNKSQIKKATKERLYKIGFEKLSRCIERYKQELEYNGTDYQFIKAGSTFFNGGYEDYLADDWRLPERRIAPVSKRSASNSNGNPFLDIARDEGII